MGIGTQIHRPRRFRQCGGFCPEVREACETVREGIRYMCFWWGHPIHDAAPPLPARWSARHLGRAGIYSLTHALTHARTQSRTHALAHALTHSRTHALTHSRTHSPLGAFGISGEQGVWSQAGMCFLRRECVGADASWQRAVVSNDDQSPQDGRQCGACTRALEPQACICPGTEAERHLARCVTCGCKCTCSVSIRTCTTCTCTCVGDMRGCARVCAATGQLGPSCGPCERCKRHRALRHRRLRQPRQDLAVRAWAHGPVAHRPPPMPTRPPSSVSERPSPHAVSKSASQQVSR